MRYLPAILGSPKFRDFLHKNQENFKILEPYSDRLSELLNQSIFYKILQLVMTAKNLQKLFQDESLKLTKSPIMRQLAD